MKIRWKVMILLLVIALTPLVGAQVIHQASAYRLGKHLAAEQRQILIEDARLELQFLVEDYGRILTRDQRMLEMALGVQACEIERRLVSPPPAARKLYFSTDYDAGVDVPGDLAESPEHFVAGPDGTATPMKVSYRDQVCFLAPGASARAAEDLVRLATMPEVYRRLHGAVPHLMHWQYASMASGAHTAFPGHGGYPKDYDPRKRDWYRAAVSAGGIVWGPPIIDVISRRPMLTLSMPVRRPDGSVVGVTGIDITMTALLAELKLPAEWERVADAMLVLPRHVRNGTRTDLLIIARQNYRNTERDWRSPAGPEVVICEDPDALAAICADAAAGRSGVRRVGCPGRDALWAHGPSRKPGEPFPLVILPYETVVAPATAAERYVLDMTVAGLQVASFLLLAVAAAVAVVALVSSRRVTRPVLELAGAARKLATGDFAARVDIRTRDELAELGRIFNATGPMLAERERMRQSLQLAMEIQQHLLPERPPRLKGFDIAGRCVYCDETGGDYYDFLELVDLGADKLGIAVGDVTGHGIAAALLMASARGALRSQAGPMGLDLPGLFGALNRHLTRDIGEGRFLTLFYGVLDGGARTLQWTSAGHDPAFWLRRASGRFEELPNTGIPLGVLDEATYGQAGPVRLASGDVVVIGTDGIWEAVDPADEPFGKDRLRRIIALHAEAPAQQVHTAVVDAVNQFRGPAPQADDITLVVIKAL